MRLLLLCGLLVGCGSNASSPAASPSPTPSPSATPEPTVTITYTWYIGLSLNKTPAPPDVTLQNDVRTLPLSVATKAVTSFTACKAEMVDSTHYTCDLTKTLGNCGFITSKYSYYAVTVATDGTLSINSDAAATTCQ